MLVKQQNVLSVIQLNNYIKRMFEKDFILKNVRVEGEISNFKRHSSGHLYFTLKDDQGAISCVMFRTYTDKIIGKVQNGAKVIIHGTVSVYEKTGQYQIYVHEMEVAGLGRLYILYEDLKEKLEKEGLFLASRKKEIPKKPKKVGIITSSTGAAIRDIEQVSKRRNPYIELVLYPALVQGEYAKDDIVKGIEYFHEKEDVDVLIVGRGGGSIEDLWPFNEEIVARKIATSKIPIISAVGHETDFTIADFVADLRAPTPSAAAELAVHNIFEDKVVLDKIAKNLTRAITYKIEQRKEKLSYLLQHIESKYPGYILDQKMHQLLDADERLYQVFYRQLAYKKQHIQVMEERLLLRSPKHKIKNGYGYLMQNGKSLTSIKEIKKEMKIDIYVQDGCIHTKVEDFEAVDFESKESR